MKKAALRNTYKEKRNTISTEERNKLDDLLLIQFQKAEIPFIQSLLSFWPIEEQKELMSKCLLQKIQEDPILQCFEISMGLSGW